MDDAQDIGDLPDELVLNPSRLKWVMVFLIGATFSVAGGFMVADGELLNGLFVAIFFGICAVVALMMLSQNSSQLRLTRDGFVERTFSLEHCLGLASIGLPSALLWDALDFTKPSGFCGGLTGYWGEAPHN